MTNALDIADRLAFIGIDNRSREILKSSRDMISAALPDVLARFYDRVRATPAVSGFFSNEQHLKTARDAQQRHWEAILEARYDDAYVASVRKIGQVHARIGLEPRWYIGGYALILEGMIEHIEARMAKGRVNLSRAPRFGAGEIIAAITKAAMLDMDYVISTYFDAETKAREAAEAQRLAEMQARADADAERQKENEIRRIEQAEIVSETGRGLTALASGDLSFRIEPDFPGEYARLKSDFNEAMGKLEDAMGVISANAAAMQTGSGEISQAADDLSRRTEQQAATLEETAAALDEITATVRRTAEGAQRANVVVTDARHDAEASGQVVSRAVTAMGEIQKSAEQISQIIGVIDEIAFQTNLLALNAGVEAARAGDAGRGFAVVASEVRALAQRSAEAAKEIKSLISASTSQVRDGVGLVGQTGEALTAIVGRVMEINGLMAEINASAQEQATALAQVNTAVNQMDQTTQQNAAMVEQSTAASHNLSQEAAELAQLVGRFQIRSASGGRTRPAARPAAANPVRAAQAR
ncbi:globin-coupled sensor protein, partial [Rhizobium sp. CRIBSB]|nr:globin-coupled sensor protein [Rhizobium sp. CRIBSB]